MVGPHDLVATRYRLERRLAATGSAALFEARDEVTDARVLVAIALDEDDSSTFERNLRAAAALTHPATARVIERGRDGTTTFGIIEVGEGETLDVSLARAGPLEARGAIRVVVQVLQALEHAHAAGLTHGVLDAPTLIVTDKDRVRVAGFGLAASGNPRDDVRAAGLLLDRLLPRERPRGLDDVVARAVGDAAPFTSAAEMRRALEDVRVHIAPAGIAAPHEGDENASTVWPIPGARYDPTTLGRRVIVVMITIALIAAAAFLWRVATRVDDLRERRARSPAPSVTSMPETPEAP